MALDVSASMAFGTADRLKADVAEGVGARARPASRSPARGRIALLSFGAATAACFRRAAGAGRWPRARVLDEGVAVDGAAPGALSDALRHLRRLARAARPDRRSSRDFREESAGPGRCGALAARHQVLAVEIVDPREIALPDAGLLVVVDPETGEQVEADTSSPELRRALRGRRAGAPRASCDHPAPGGRPPRRAGHRRTTGCARSGRGCGELRGARSSSPRCVLIPLGDRRSPGRAAGAAGATRCACPPPPPWPRCIPRVPAWRRHLPAALLAAAVAALAVALARPQTTVAVPWSRRR